MKLRRGLRRRLRRTVVLHTRDGRSFRGVLVAEYADCLVLEQAVHLDVGVRLGGQTIVLLENVSWAQDVTGLEHEAARDDAFAMQPGERP